MGDAEREQDQSSTHGDAGAAGALRDDGPRRRGRWLRRCPFCPLEIAVVRGALECTCGTIVLPVYRGPLPSHATAGCHPRWEDDHRLEDGTWDRYSRRGRLNKRLDELDVRLELEARDNLDRIQEIAGVIRTLREQLQRDGAVGRKRSRARVDNAPTAVAALRETWITILCWAAIQLDNARLVRGGRPDEITRPRRTRAEPCGGLGHALAAAYGTSEGPRTSAPGGGAVATHALPRGVQFGRMAVNPSASGRVNHEPELVEIDVQRAVLAARVGTSTRYEDGRTVSEPGRPLTPTEMELLRLVDVGELFPVARTSTRHGVLTIERDAVERLHPRDAVARLKGQPGAPRNEEEARRFLKEARHAIRRVLQEREIIPAGTAPPARRAPRPSSDPFEGVGL